VTNELRGEKIDIILWASSPANFVVNALAPAEISRIVFDEESRSVEAVVADDQLSLAIGRRGQNVRLATLLTGLEINIITEGNDSERRSKEASKHTELFMRALDVDEMIAHLLSLEGFTSVEDIAYVEQEVFLSIEGFDEDIALELQRRAQEYLEEEKGKLLDQCKDLGISDDLLTLDFIPCDILLILGENNIKTRDQLADLSTDEFIEILGDRDISQEDANTLILRSREHWFSGNDTK
jgi:N utilization substance protein A